MPVTCSPARTTRGSPASARPRDAAPAVKPASRLLAHRHRGDRAADDAACRAPRPRLAARAVRPARLLITGRVPRRARGAALIVLAAMAVLTSGCGGSSEASALQGRLLSVADLPAGWSAAPANPHERANQCAVPVGPARQPEGMDVRDRGLRGRHLDPGTRRGPGHRPAGSADVAKPRPGTGTLPDGHLHHRGAQKAKATIQPLSFPRVAGTSVGLRVGLHHRGNPDRLRLCPVHRRGLRGLSHLLRPGTARGCDGAGVRAAAVAKAETGSTAPRHGRGLDRLRAGADRAHTAGHHRLPHHRKRTATGLDHRVQRNHAGLGPALRRRPGPALPRRDLRQRRHRTDAALPAPLSIDAMANQTSALIGTLRLGRPDVLGWSMGSMTAQALAVLHPGQVRRLVLCAS